MATRFRFYDAVDGEPSYGSEAFAQWSKGILSEGYVPGVGDELEVTESSPAAMSVRVGLGIAWVDGRFFEVYDSAETLTIPAADGSNPRIDRVVVRNDLDNRETVLAVKAGSPASSPDPPSLTRTETVYEISLAQVLVGAGATSIENDDIEDERDDEDMCGQAVAQQRRTVARGQYTGNDTPNRVIDVGYTPDILFISNDSTGATRRHWTLIRNGRTLMHENDGHDSVSSIAIVENGFELGGDVSGANSAGSASNPFRWVAIGGA